MIYSAYNHDVTNGRVLYLAHDPEEAAHAVPNNHLSTALAGAGRLLAHAYSFHTPDALTAEVSNYGPALPHELSWIEWRLSAARVYAPYNGTPAPTHADWTAASFANYCWTFTYAATLALECVARLGASDALLACVWGYEAAPMADDNDGAAQPVPLVPEQFVVLDGDGCYDTVESYRTALRMAQHELVYTTRKPPEWLAAARTVHKAVTKGKTVFTL
jgi:hypothetical protein